MKRLAQSLSRYCCGLLSIIMLLLSVSTGSVQASVVINTFSNTTELALGPPANYDFALNFGTTTDQTIDGVLFDGITSSGGDVTFTAGANFSGAAPDFDSGGSSENSLEALMQTIRWDGGIGADPFTVSLSGLTSGQWYKLQLLMWDPGGLGNNGRTFDVHVNGSLIINHDLDLWDYGASSAGSAPDPDRGVNASYVFLAPVSGDVDITYTRVGNSGVLSALTLQETTVPEPSTALLIVFAGSLLTYKRMRDTRHAKQIEFL